MRRQPTRFVRKALVIAAIGSTLVSSISAPLHSAPPFLERIFQVGARQGHPPKTVHDPSIEELAKNIDWLEHEIDRWGTVVAKAPDVWGEARLTKYRAEVEREFAKDVETFEPNQINGAQLISDQAFLAASFAMNSQRAGIRPLAVPTANVTVANSTSTSSQTAVTANATASPDALAPFGLDDRAKVAILGSIKLEQTEVLDQKKRYLDHLNELRRLNEGDDVSDSPGYSLNLLRIPISILPGKHSQEGYGAEITVTATPELGPELLPTAFRDFVINDLVDQLSVPLVQFLNTDPKRARETIEKLESIEALRADLARQFGNAWLVSDDPELLAVLNATNAKFHYFDVNSGRFQPLTELTEQAGDWLLQDLRQLTELFASLKKLQDVASVAQAEEIASVRAFTPRSLAAPNESVTVDVQDARLSAVYEVVERQAIAKEQTSAGFESIPAPLNSGRPQANASTPSERTARQAGSLYAKSIQSNAQMQTSEQNLSELISKLESLARETKAITNVSFPNSARRSTMPFPPSQLIDNYGMHDLAHFALDAYRTFESEIINRQVIHLTDVQGYLREELSAAYDMMALPAVECFWSFEASGEKTLVEALRHRRTDAVAELREGFRVALAPHLLHSSTLTMAWCVFVESLLLNERILDDMKNNNAGTVWLPLFGPNPPCEARDAFAAYVAQRWPVKVFAIDPVVNEQNILDVSSISRQMQLAVALSFAGGEMSASTAMQTLRQLQRDTATIDLNRTIVGFGHGENTFGWRFYPRFQTPPVESNVTVFFRDLVVGGPTDNQLLRSKQIEPGMRECVAIVLMPSFVPGVSFDTRCNWFRLDKPSHTALSMLETMQYSRSIVAMRDNATACTRCPERYRPGELDRLLKRVQQLDAELPLQTLRVPLPIENSHGGFEIFSSGTRELAPELLGWYGAPGYDIAKGGTFFLAGDNFSIHETKLLVGNASHQYELISRQILQVKLPPGLQIVKDERLKAYHDRLNLSDAINHYEGFVDAHVATPYGVSGHLLIPVIASNVEPECNCTVELLSGDIRASLTLAKKDDTWSAPGTLNVGQMPLVSFQAPKVPGLTSKLAKISIQPTSDDDDGRLTPIVIADVPSDGDVFSLAGAKAIAALRAGGDLQKSVAEYAIWRAGRGNKDDFVLTCTLSIEIGGITFTAGSVKMFVDVITPPGA